MIYTQSYHYVMKYAHIPTYPTVPKPTGIQSIENTLAQMWHVSVPIALGVKGKYTFNIDTRRLFDSSAIILSKENRLHVKMLDVYTTNWQFNVHIANCNIR